MLSVTKLAPPRPLFTSVLIKSVVVACWHGQIVWFLRFDTTHAVHRRSFEKLSVRHSSVWSARLLSLRNMGGGEILKKGWLIKSPPLDGSSIKVKVSTTGRPGYSMKRVSIRDAARGNRLGSERGQTASLWCVYFSMSWPSVGGESYVLSNNSTTVMPGV